jgi:hypothetical protein
MNGTVEEWVAKAEAYYYEDLLQRAPVNRVTLRFGDAETGRPLKEVEVRRAWQPMRLETSNGTMEVVAFGHWPSTISVRAEGYRPARARLDPGTPRRVNAVLEPAADSKDTPAWDDADQSSAGGHP